MLLRGGGGRDLVVLRLSLMQSPGGPETGHVSSSWWPGFLTALTAPSFLWVPCPWCGGAWLRLLFGWFNWCFSFQLQEDPGNPLSGRTEDLSSPVHHGLCHQPEAWGHEVRLPGLTPPP